MDISNALIDQVNTARTARGQLNIRGRNSKKFMGREAQGEGIDVAEHSGILEYQPVELVMTARAGTALSEIEATLAAHNQMLSFEPPRYGGDGSIGGVLACNQSGPSRPWAGSVRDMVLGTRLINGKGEHLRFGGQVMKNVAGYDLSRLQAGAMGSFGIITEVSFKVLPKPTVSDTLVFEVDAARGIQVMQGVAATASPLSAACWYDHKLYLRLSGPQGAVEATSKQWRSALPGNGPGNGCCLGDAEAAQFWQGVRDHRHGFFSRGGQLWRFSLQSSAPHFLPAADWFIDWGGAQRWLWVDESAALTPQAISLEAMQADAVNACGQVSLFRGGDRRGEVFQALPAPVNRLHRRLKNAFDPDHLFNPGRLYGWL